MKSINSMCMIFLFFLIGLFSGLQASTAALESVDLSNCQLIKISSEQILISEGGLNIVDLEENELLDVEGFIRLENEMYAIQKVGNVIPKRPDCGHGRGCFKCGCCINPKCWRRCRCKK